MKSSNTTNLNTLVIARVTTKQPGATIKDVLDHLYEHMHFPVAFYSNIKEVRTAGTNQLASRIITVGELPHAAGDVSLLYAFCEKALEKHSLLIMLDDRDFERVLASFAAMCLPAKEFPENVAIARLNPGMPIMLLDARELSLVGEPEDYRG